MKKTSLAVLVSLAALAGAAHAQESTEIRTITDPGQIAAIEAHAQAIHDQQQAPVAHEEEHHVKPVHHHHPVLKPKKDDKPAK